MSTLSIKEISAMLDRGPKAIHKQIRMGKLKAKKEFSYVTSPYIIREKDFAKYLCETPAARADFNRYVLNYVKRNRVVSIQLRAIVQYMLTNLDWYVYSASELAKVLDVTPQSIHNWVRKGYLEEDAGPGLYSRKSVLGLAKKHPRFAKFMPKNGVPVSIYMPHKASDKFMPKGGVNL